MIISINGGLGSGKTFLLTILAQDAQKSGRTVYSNYKLNFPHKPIDVDEIIKMEIFNGFIAGDEIYTWIDSRVSGTSKKNRLFSYFIFQSRKRHTDIAYTAQLNSSVDKRLKQLADYIVKCERNPSNPKKELKFFRYTILSDNKVSVKIVKRENMDKVFALYDTDELVKP